VPASQAKPMEPTDNQGSRDDGRTFASARLGENNRLPRFPAPTRNSIDLEFFSEFQQSPVMKENLRRT